MIRFPGGSLLGPRISAMRPATRCAINSCESATAMSTRSGFSRGEGVKEACELIRTGRQFAGKGGSWLEKWIPGCFTATARGESVVDVSQTGDCSVVVTAPSVWLSARRDRIRT